MNEESDVQERAPASAVDQNLTTAAVAGRASDQAQREARPLSDEHAPLLPENETGEFQKNWDSIQASFVDDPRRSVEQADSLVASAIKRIAEQFADERSRLEGQWGRGDDVSTENLRIALQRYRSFFARLLSI